MALYRVQIEPEGEGEDGERPLFLGERERSCRRSPPRPDPLKRPRTSHGSTSSTVSIRPARPVVRRTPSAASTRCASCSLLIAPLVRRAPLTLGGLPCAALPSPRLLSSTPLARYTPPPPSHSSPSPSSSSSSSSSLPPRSFTAGTHLYAPAPASQHTFLASLLTQLGPRALPNPDALDRRTAEKALTHKSGVDKGALYRRSSGEQDAQSRSAEEGGRIGHNEKLAFVGESALPRLLPVALAGLHGATHSWLASIGSLTLNSSTGRRALRLHLTQHLFTRLSSSHPTLLAQALSAPSRSPLSLDALLDTKNLGAGVGRQWGVEGVLRWREVRGHDGEVTGLYKCRGSAVEAVIGAVYTTQVRPLSFSSASTAGRDDGEAGPLARAVAPRVGRARSSGRPRLAAPPRSTGTFRPSILTFTSRLLLLSLPRSQGIDASSHVFEHLVLPHLALPRSLSAALSGAPAPVPAPAPTPVQHVEQVVGGAQA